MNAAQQPEGDVHKTSGDEINCPWCGSANNHVASPFGGSVSEVLMQCDDCHASFGWMKWRAKASKPTN